MAYIPLATPSDLVDGPLANVVRSLTASQQQKLCVRASRAIETYCQRRLTPFTITETCRALDVDAEETWDAVVMLDPQSELALSRAQSLGATALVRHIWLKQYPPVWNELWQGSITSITILRAIAGSQVIQGNDLSSLQYEQDTGHVRFYYGAYIPPGSTIATVYSGGYSPVPDELIQACVLRATKMALVTLDPEERTGHDLDVIDAEIEDILGDFVAAGDDF